MKRRLLSFVVAAIFILTLFGCGNSSIKGTKWCLTGAEFQGMQISSKEMGAFGTLEFSKDNVVKMYYDNDQNDAGTYTVNGSKVTIKDNNTGEELSGTIDGKKMTFEYQGAKLFFEKQ